MVFSDSEKRLKFEAASQEFANFLRLINLFEQCKVRTIFETKCVGLVPRGFSELILQNKPTIETFFGTFTGLD